MITSGIDLNFMKSCESWVLHNTQAHGHKFFRSFRRFALAYVRPCPASRALGIGQRPPLVVE